MKDKKIDGVEVWKELEDELAPRVRAPVAPLAPRRETPTLVFGSLAGSSGKA